MTPYYDDGTCTIYHAGWRDVMPSLEDVDVLVTDPPYPNNAGHFDSAVTTARDAMTLSARHIGEALIFWNELEQPPCAHPLVAVHIWHRTNVNGRPYEPIYHFCSDGEKRRSRVFPHSVPFTNATGSEYVGHPTQKPVDLMRALLSITRRKGVVLDPFMGSGTTLRAAKDLGRRAIGIEINEFYCEIAARRLGQEVLPLEAS
jgi:DNA modification methylase